MSAKPFPKLSKCPRIEVQQFWSTDIQKFLKGLQEHSAWDSPGSVVSVNQLGPFLIREEYRVVQDAIETAVAAERTRILVRGSPGIGKSSWLLWYAACVAKRGMRVLYATEEPGFVTIFQNERGVIVAEEFPKERLEILKRSGDDDPDTRGYGIVFSDVQTAQALNLLRASQIPGLIVTASLGSLEVMKRTGAPTWYMKNSIEIGMNPWTLQELETLFPFMGKTSADAESAFLMWGGSVRNCLQLENSRSATSSLLQSGGSENSWILHNLYHAKWDGERPVRYWASAQVKAVAVQCFHELAKSRADELLTFTAGGMRGALFEARVHDDALHGRLKGKAWRFMKSYPGNGVPAGKPLKAGFQFPQFNEKAQFMTLDALRNALREGVWFIPANPQFTLLDAVFKTPEGEVVGVQCTISSEHKPKAEAVKQFCEALRISQLHIVFVTELFIPDQKPIGVLTHTVHTYNFCTLTTTGTITDEDDIDYGGISPELARSMLSVGLLSVWTRGMLISWLKIHDRVKASGKSEATLPVLRELMLQSITSDTI